ncbi:TPA: iron chelate uptake ABC transporter family permease subunit [Mannheimia haemolytica]
MAQQTPYLLLDEPLAALDIVYQVEVMQLIRKLVNEQGLTVIIIIHDINLASQFCDEIIALKQGELCIQGSVDEIMQEQKLLEIFGLKLHLFTVWILLSVAILLISATLLFIKPLRLISLGETVSYHLGLEVKKVQMIVLLLIALMSAASTLAVGPMSFIGLMTPHLAKNLGAITPEKQIPISALLGAMLMLIADWLGRYLIFPYEIGAGIIASILGGIYFLLLLKQHK